MDEGVNEEKASRKAVQLLKVCIKIRTEFLPCIMCSSQPGGSLCVWLLRNRDEWCLNRMRRPGFTGLISQPAFIPLTKCMALL